MQNSRKYSHWLFELGVVIKGIDGVLEIIGGLLLSLISTRSINAFLIFLTQHELSQDRDDVISNMLIHFVSGHIGSKTFGAIFLLSHGILKVFLVYNLLRERLWVFPVAMGVMEAFILYQLYRVHAHHSFGLLVLTALDLFVLLFVWKEYQVRLKTVERPKPAC